MSQQNDLNKKLLYAVIGLSAVVVLGIGILIGTLLSSKGSSCEAVPETIEDTLVEEPTNEELEAETEKARLIEEARIAEEARRQAEAEAKAARAAARAEAAKKEKTYGYYPSFYVKKTNYTVSCREGMHPIAIYTDGSTKVKRAWTDSRWLEEEDIDEGDYRFHVKENDDDDSRSGKLYIKDDKGRTITIYVTQLGER